MSMEMRVFFSGSVPKLSAIDATVRTLGLGLALTDPGIDFVNHRGFLPMTLSAGESIVEAGCEVDHGDARASISNLGIGGLDSSLERELSLRWGGDLLHAGSALALAVAVQRLTGGVIYDDDTGAIVSADVALVEARSAFAAARS